MTRGIVSLVFDDGYEQVYQNVLPLLSQYRFPGVFAIPLDPANIQISTSRRVKLWPEWMSLREQGHEIAAHSITHTNLKNCTDAELDHELAEPARLLAASTIVYPGGAHDSRVAKAAAQYYTAGRTVSKRLENIPPDHPLRLGTYNWHVNIWSLRKANLLALFACISNHWLIETFHMVDDNEKQMPHTVRTAEFARHLAFINRLPLQVKTIQDVINISSY